MCGQITLHEMWCMSRSVVMMKLPITSFAHSCSLLIDLKSFHGGMFNLNTKFDADSLLCLLSHFECEVHMVHMLTQCRLLSPLDYYSEIVIVHACTFQSTHLSCQVTSMSCKSFLLYEQWLNFFRTNSDFSLCMPITNEWYKYTITSKLSTENIT